MNKLTFFKVLVIVAFTTNASGAPSDTQLTTDPVEELKEDNTEIPIDQQPSTPLPTSTPNVTTSVPKTTPANVEVSTSASTAKITTLSTTTPVSTTSNSSSTDHESKNTMEKDETKSTTTTVPPPGNLERKPEVKLGPVVNISSGNVRPKIMSSRNGRKYYGFLGIPYASPPTQFLRYKNPAPPAPWTGILNATEFKSPCIQYDVIADKVLGEEDCLYLNVFTPQVVSNEVSREPQAKFPVIVFIHQGAFMFGSASDYGADYMMDHDVVLVTISYRLGSFGFLNTEGGSDALGNMGLLDQVRALHWIQENIERFGGEKHLVTIMGESAGGASVHYHMLSEKSRGLFSRAISMSGTALSPWAFTRTPRKNALKLGALLNCPTTVMHELVECLRLIDAREIAEKHKAFFEWGTDPIAPFGPSVQAVSLNNEHVFLSDTPYALMQSGHINDNAPWMLGLTQDVCLLDAWSILIDTQLTADMNHDWHRVAPLTFSFRDTALEPDAVSNQLHAFYFRSLPIGNETARNLVNLYSDRLFNHATRTTALLHGKYNEGIPVYLYMFAYQGEESHMKFLDISEKLGVSEGDELQYLFNMESRFATIGKNHPDAEFSDRFINLWLSFAKSGKPKKTWTNGENQWSPMSLEQVKGDEALMFYSIDKNCSFIDEPFADRMSFWDNLPLNELNNELLSPLRRTDLDGQQELFFPE